MHCVETFYGTLTKACYKPWIVCCTCTARSLFSFGKNEKNNFSTVIISPIRSTLIGAVRRTALSLFFTTPSASAPIRSMPPSDLRDLGEAPRRWLQKRGDLRLRRRWSGPPHVWSARWWDTRLPYLLHFYVESRLFSRHLRCGNAERTSSCTPATSSTSPAGRLLWFQWPRIQHLLLGLTNIAILMHHAMPKVCDYRLCFPRIHWSPHRDLQVLTQLVDWCSLICFPIGDMSI